MNTIDQRYRSKIPAAAVALGVLASAPVGAQGAITEQITIHADLGSSPPLSLYFDGSEYLPPGTYIESSFDGSFSFEGTAGAEPTSCGSMGDLRPILYSDSMCADSASTSSCSSTMYLKSLEAGDPAPFRWNLSNGVSLSEPLPVPGLPAFNLTHLDHYLDCVYEGSSVGWIDGSHLVDGDYWLTYIPSLAPVIPCGTPLESSLPGPTDRRGQSVDYISGRAVVGSPQRSVSGAASIHRGRAGEWVLDAELVPPQPTGPGAGFGWAVAIDGDRAVIGAPFEGSSPSAPGTGAAYVYERDGSQFGSGDWHLILTLEPSGTTSSDDQFGYAVDIRADLIVIGAIGDDTSATEGGALYVYRRTGPSWALEAKLVSSSPDPGARLGASACLGSNRLLAGAPGQQVGAVGNAGAAHIFEIDGSGSWSHVAQLNSTTPTSGDAFGHSVTLSASRAAVGAPLASTAGLVQIHGSVAGSGWGEEATLVPTQPAGNQRFGESVQLDGDLLAVGAPGTPSAATPGSGMVSVYSYQSGSAWTLQQTVEASTPVAGDGFGASLGLDKKVLLVGSPGAASGGAPGSGVAFAFDLGTRDCNGNGVADACDIASGGSSDCNGNLIPDECDLSAGTAVDCNGNGTPDECDIAAGLELDCNGNGVPDSCEIQSGEGLDCNGNGVLDSCEIASGAGSDCDGNGQLDACDIAAGITEDCNLNGVPDSCEATSLRDFAPGFATTGIGAPWCVEFARVDSDGDQDLVVADRNAGELLWFYNDGLGGLGGPVVIDSGAADVFSIEAADIDGDGDPDLLTAASATDRISLYVNLGGTFSPPIVLSDSMDGARVVHANDLDGDGDLDVIAGSTDDDTVAWFQNLGGGSFSGLRLISSACDHILCVDTADMDGDGDPDVIAASRDDDRVRIFENIDGLGGTWAIHDACVVDGPNFVRAADLDADGDLDLAVTALNDGQVLWVENDGSGTQFLPTPVVDDSLTRASCVQAGDLDQDGWPDLVAGNYGSDPNLGLPPDGMITWYRNLGQGRFGARRVVSNGLDRTSFVTIGELDGTGGPDVAGVAWRDGALYTQLNLLLAPTAEDCNENGVPDECELPFQDHNKNGTLDECEAVGTTYCAPATPNSTGHAGELRLFGTNVVFLNSLEINAYRIPANAFGFFIASTTPGSVFPVPNSQGTLCVVGDVGRGVGGGILNSGPEGHLQGSVNLNAIPQPVGTVMVQPGDTWHFQAWHRDGVNGQSTSNFTDAVAVTFQ